MKGNSVISNLQRKKLLRLGLLLGSSVGILSASIFVYSRIVIEKTLNVGNAGTGSTVSETTLSTPAIVTLAFLSFVISLSVYGLLREAFKRLSGRGSSLKGQVPVHSENDEWEESPQKKEDEFIPHSG
jgi:ABC-type multidrug transport system permease subunit